MRDNTLLWVWLTTLRGMTAAKITSLLDKFESVEEIYSKNSEDDFKNIALIRQNDINSLINKDTQKAEKIINQIEDEKIIAVNSMRDILAVEGEYYNSANAMSEEYYNNKILSVYFPLIFRKIGLID